MMENQSLDANMEIEEFPDEFQCCVCLDIMYKPVVLACGHISCFWCVFKAMDTFQESHCPVCRNPYHHFPRICKLLHILLLKLYPSAYIRRERQVAEEEKIYGHASPQFEDNLLDSQFTEVLDVQDSSSPPVTIPSMPKFPHEGVNFPEEDSITSTPTASNSQNPPRDNSCIVEHKDSNVTCSKALLADLKCSVCKELLCRPVVLNCGHVYCETCIHNLHDSGCRCPVCQCLHPNGFPNVCLVLEHFLEEHFPVEYSARKKSLVEVQSGSPSGSLAEKQQQGAKHSSVPSNVFSCWRSGTGPNFHPGVGCDYCGMCPIIGKRYKCKDCVEKIGFDLCEGCYNSSSKLPGRFNQQHTEEHQFVVVQQSHLRNIILSLGAADHPDDFDVSFVNPNNPEEVFMATDLSNDVSEDELERAQSPISADDDAQGEQDVVFPPVTSNDLLGDQGR